MALVVITGGARCGKSAVAEDLALRRHGQTGQEVCVVDFANPLGDDIEFAERVSGYVPNRPECFSTLQAFDKRNWLAEVDDGAIVIVDCLATALSSIIAHDDWQTVPSDSIKSKGEGPISQHMSSMIEGIINRDGDTIVVTNEVGSGPAPEYESSRIFRDQLGRANRMLAAHADAAYLCVAGHLISLSDLPSSIDWPED